MSRRSILPTSSPNGNGTASASRPCRPRRRRAQGARIYSRTGDDISPALSRPRRRLRLRWRRSTASCSSCEMDASRASTTCSSASTGRASTGKADRGFPRPHPRLRSPDRRHGGFAPAALRRAARAARGVRRSASAEPRIDLSPALAFASLDDSPRRAPTRCRRRRRGCRSGRGLMLKRRDSPYLPAGPRACGSNGSATRRSSTPC